MSVDHPSCAALDPVVYTSKSQLEVTRTVCLGSGTVIGDWQQRAGSAECAGRIASDSFLMTICLAPEQLALHVEGGPGWHGRVPTGSLAILAPGSYFEGEHKYARRYFFSARMAELEAHLPEPESARHGLDLLQANYVVDNAMLRVAMRAVCSLSEGDSPESALLFESIEASTLGLIASSWTHRGNGLARTARKPAQGLALAKAAMDDEPLRPHSVTQLAVLSGLSKYHFIRSFSATYGFTPHQYKIHRRIYKACEFLLAAPSVASAATRAGYSNLSLFSAHFKSVTGISPRHYFRSRQR